MGKKQGKNSSPNICSRERKQQNKGGKTGRTCGESGFLIMEQKMLQKLGPRKPAENVKVKSNYVPDAKTEGVNKERKSNGNKKRPEGGGVMM